jgi:murein DD-endopeptidase MepM/ murein hydrolase activator NlpD
VNTKHRRAGGALIRSALAAVALAGCVDDAPDVGTLAPIYATPAEDYQVFKLRQGETLGGLLQGSVSGNEQAGLLLAFREQASPRRIRAGTEITLRYRPDDHWLRGVDVAINRDQTVRLRRDLSGWSSERIETPVYVDTVLAAGSIETVLWTSVVNSPALAGMTYGDRSRLIDHLDRVFQWQVDFSRQIRVGDSWRFAFEREVRPDGSMRAGRLLAAELVNAGTPYYAVWFDPNGDGDGSYYDLQGRSVRRAFLLKPLAYRRISSRFSGSRYHPILKTWRAHRGIDYAANAGTEIMATADGVVIHRARKGSFGNMVEIRHPNGFVTRYAHMSSFKRGVVLGTRVHQGDIIGYVGMTGSATGPHLHYEMLRGGKQMDPLSVDLPAGDPVPSEDLGRWNGERTARLALLESVPGGGPVRTAQAEAPEAPESESAGDHGGER